ncbi:hypothetical protein AB9K17_24050, partial [Salmonella enterica subsp. enterica serovar Kentucky]|uniref:hypothetical protein n=1 Tax=Salmonella enterica TaxID=28901 RepID=UPI003F4C71F2
SSLTGEFGVVYKAQYTEPEGDIGYKTSTVAVKTLKGNLEFFITCSNNEALSCKSLSALNNQLPRTNIDLAG